MATEEGVGTDFRLISKPGHRYLSHFLGSLSFTFTGASSCVSMDSSILTTPIPFSTWPKTTCLPSKCDVGTVVMKNWEPLVLGPALAMLRRPTLSCCVKKDTHDTQHKTKKHKNSQETSKSVYVLCCDARHCGPTVTYFCRICHLPNLMIVTIFLCKLQWNWPTRLDSEHHLVDLKVIIISTHTKILVCIGSIFRGAQNEKPWSLSVNRAFLSTITNY